MCANPMTIANFFTQYQGVCDEYNIDSPLYIWNCDESGVQDIPKEEEVIGVWGEKVNLSRALWAWGDKYHTHFCKCLWPGHATSSDT